MNRSVLSLGLMMASETPRLIMNRPLASCVYTEAPLGAAIVYGVTLRCCMMNVVSWLMSDVGAAARVAPGVVSDLAAVLDGLGPDRVRRLGPVAPHVEGVGDALRLQHAVVRDLRGVVVVQRVRDGALEAGPVEHGDGARRPRRLGHAAGPGRQRQPRGVGVAGRAAGAGGAAGAGRAAGAASCRRCPACRPRRRCPSCRPVLVVPPVPVPPVPACRPRRRCPSCRPRPSPPPVSPAAGADRCRPC